MGVYQEETISLSKNAGCHGELWQRSVKKKTKKHVSWSQRRHEAIPQELSSDKTFRINAHLKAQHVTSDAGGLQVKTKDVV